MSDESFFNLKDTTDLPESMKLPYTGMRKENLNILSLFKIKEILSIDEVCVGYFRKFKEELPRKTIRFKLLDLKYRKYLEAVGGGKYRILKEYKNTGR